MKSLFAALLLLPCSLFAQHTPPALAMQVGALPDEFVDGDGGAWASLGLSWRLAQRFDVAARAEYATGARQISLCSYNTSCGAPMGPREPVSAFVGDLLWWTGRGNGMHVTLAPGLAFQHMSSARTPYQRKDWLSPQFSAAVAWTHGPHTLSGGFRWRSDNQWVHSSTRFTPTWWVGWQRTRLSQ